jgi:hypothetical protein
MGPHPGGRLRRTRRLRQARQGRAIWFPLSGLRIWRDTEAIRPGRCQVAIGEQDKFSEAADRPPTAQSEIAKILLGEHLLISGFRIILFWWQPRKARSSALWLLHDRE